MDIWDVAFDKYISELDWVSKVSPDEYATARKAFLAGWKAAIESVIKKMEARNG